MARLIFSLEEGEEVVVPLAGTISIGREEDNDVMIDDECISRHHAEIVVHADGRIEVLDVGSTTGTFVDGRPVRSAFVKPGDKVAIGPVLGRIEEDPPTVDAAAAAELQKQFEKLQADMAAAEAKHRELSAAIAEMSAELNMLSESRAAADKEVKKLTNQRDDERDRLQKLREEVTAEEKRLASLRSEAAALETQQQSRMAERERLEAQIRSLAAEDDQLSSRQRAMGADAERVVAETKTRAAELATTMQQLEDASAKLSKTESRLNELADLDRRIREATDQLSAIEKQKTDARAALQKTEAELSARDSQLRTATAGVRVNSTAESAQDELTGLETRLTPLRDWKKAMDDRQARLASAPPGSAEEGRLMNEIEEAYGTLYDLLPAARIDSHGMSRTDFVRARTKAGVPMKSERIRRSGA